MSVPVKRPRREADRPLPPPAPTEAEPSEERDPDQAWYWSEEWQAGERRVDEYLRKGQVEDFESMDDFLASLDD